MDLEDELKRLFQDERLDVQVAAEAEHSVVAGARRVRRRRAMLLSAAGGLTAVALATGALVLTKPASDTVNFAEPPAFSITPTTEPSQTTPSAEPSPTVPNAPPSVNPGGQPPPVGTTTKRSTATSKPGTPTSTNSPPAVTPGQPIGAYGYGKIKLGMSQTALVATGQVDAGTPSGNCTTYKIKSGGTVKASTANGVVDINPTATTTQEGISIGSTVEDAKAKYPDFTGTSGDSVKVPGDPTAVYLLSVANGVISGIRQQSTTSDC